MLTIPVTRTPLTDLVGLLSWLAMLLQEMEMVYKLSCDVSHNKPRTFTTTALSAAPCSGFDFWAIGGPAPQIEITL